MWASVGDIILPRQHSMPSYQLKENFFLSLFLLSPEDKGVILFSFLFPSKY